MAVYLTEVVTDLAMPPQQRPIPHQFAMGDNNAYTITALLCDSRNPEAELLDGTVGGELVRPDGVTVALAGEKGDAVRQVNLAAGGLCNATPCSVTLPQACFAVPGRVTLTIKLTEGTTITQALSVSAVVVRTSTDEAVDPGEVIPDLAAIQAVAAEAVEAAEDATAAAADARAAASSAVRYDTAQSLTDAQKAQARANAGAASQNAMTIISRGHGENLIALTDFTEVFGDGTSYTVDTENQTITVTSTSGTYRCLQTPVNWVQNHLTPGHTYRLHAKFLKVSGIPEARVAFRGGANGADIVNYAASIIYPDPNNGGDAFVDYTVDRFTRRITLFVSFGRAYAASVVFSDIWLVDVTDARNLAPVDNPTATATHASGSLLTVSGQLYKATQAIATGETITPGTNVASTTVAAQLAERDTAIAAETAAREKEVSIRDANDPANWLYKAIFGDDADFGWMPSGTKRYRKIGRVVEFGKPSGTEGSTFNHIALTGTEHRVFDGNDAQAIASIKSYGDGDFIDIPPLLGTIQSQTTAKHMLILYCYYRISAISTGGGNSCGLSCVFRRYNASSQQYEYTNFLVLSHKYELNAGDYGILPNKNNVLASSGFVKDSVFETNLANYEQVAIYASRHTQGMSGTMLIEPRWEQMPLTITT